MEESSYDQAILASGEARGQALGQVEGETRGRLAGQLQEARGLLLRLADRRFNSVTPADRAAIEAVDDLERLHDWADVILDDSSWAEFRAAAGLVARDPDPQTG